MSKQTGTQPSSSSQSGFSGSGSGCQSVMWKQFVLASYPEALSTTYCVPPIHFNRVPYHRINVPGIPTSLPALVQQLPIDNSTATANLQTPATSVCIPIQSVPSTGQLSNVQPSSKGQLPCTAVCSNTQSDPSVIQLSSTAQSQPVPLNSSQQSCTSVCSQTQLVLSAGQQPSNAPFQQASSNSQLPCMSASSQTQPVSSVSQMTSNAQRQLSSPSRQPSSNSSSIYTQPLLSTKLALSSKCNQKEQVSQSVLTAIINQTQSLHTTVQTASTTGCIQSVAALTKSQISSRAGYTQSQPVQVSVTGSTINAITSSSAIGTNIVSSTSSTQAQQTVPSCTTQSSLSPYSLWTPDPCPHISPSPVFRSDMSDDFSQQYLLYNLQALGKHLGEVMFILSEVNFKNYLSSPSFKASAKKLQFPQPKDLSKRMEGDFDFLLINKHRGILIGELKSVGRNRAELQLSLADDDANVVKRVGKAAKQLVKGRTVVNHLVSDVVQGLPVHCALFLPFVSQIQFFRVLTANSAFAKSVYSSLGVSSAQEAVDMTLCSDQLSDHNVYWDVTPDVITHLTAWWHHRMTSCQGQHQLTDDEYLNIVGRFVGPATTVAVHCNVRPRITVEVRTEGQTVAELGSRLARLVLTPQQVDLLNRSPPRVYLTGPPGTGKSVLLILNALGWLHRGWNVQVVDTSDDSMAACMMVYHQIVSTLRAGIPNSSVGAVSLRSFRFQANAYHCSGQTSVDAAVQELAQGAHGGPLCLVMDEMTLNFNHAELVSKLLKTDANLHLWAAEIRHKDCWRIPQLQVETMTTPLRSAPCITRKVQDAIRSNMYSDAIHPYSMAGLPSPGDGLEPVVMYHEDGSDQHSGEKPFLCFQCGQDIAAMLRHLGVGDKVRQVPNSPDPLQYRDVLILKKSVDKEEDEVFDEVTGDMIAPASEMIRGLRAEGIPVTVIQELSFTEEMQRTHRLKKHVTGGCTIDVENEFDEFDLNALMDNDTEPYENEWDSLSLEAKDKWRRHFQEGCNVESQEDNRLWEKKRLESLDSWKAKMEDMATSRDDCVTVASERYVQGLERRVVVVLIGGSDLDRHPSEKMSCMSRCTTHLVTVMSL